MHSLIPYGRQSVSEEDIQAVVGVLRSDWLTQGPVVEQFEKAVADYCGSRFAVAVNSGTSALHIACLAADLGPGDILWTSPVTFVASANCALYCGAGVDFVDIDPRTCNMSVDCLREKLERAEHHGKLPKVVIPVHFAGQSCEMEAIQSLSQRYGFRIIEDASHAAGGRYKGNPVGNCRYSSMTVFSFHPVKIITSGEGGMVLTNSSKLHRRLVRLRSHGITRDPELMAGESHGPWYYQQIELGYNYRMTDIQAALGVSQTTRLDDFVIRRRRLAARYDSALADLPIRGISLHEDSVCAYHLYVIMLESHRRAEIFEALRSAGIGVNVHYLPVHMQPYFTRFGFTAGMFPRAEEYYRKALTLPLFADMTDTQFRHVVRTVRGLLT
jgi:UDP-4-amino-4,6-dideoxy-N-acetyl-beta-L-altrosamine transaminase